MKKYQSVVLEIDNPYNYPMDTRTLFITAHGLSWTTCLKIIRAFLVSTSGDGLPVVEWS